MEKMISSYLRKGLEIPLCLNNVGLYGQGAFELPLISLEKEFKCSKERMEMTIAEPQDAVIRNAGPSLGGGQKMDIRRKQ